jgi:cyclic pyranopterin phosphate synthase
VTDRCNFRCRYCMPKELFGEAFRYLPQAEILTYEEITRLSRLFRELGVEKLRLTGGEPLLRRDLPDLVAMLRRIPGMDLALTTNGSLLTEMAGPLAEAGLGRVTVSVDCLDEETFRRMNDVDFPLSDVLDGIDTAAAAGLAPIKINAVVKRGVNEHAVVELARYFRERGMILRFIEYMDVGTTNGWRLDDVVPAREIVATIDRVLPIEAVEANYPGEVARRWRYRDGGGEIGIIASVTAPFCGGCTRARLSADGRLYTCLFSEAGHDLRGPLRSGWDDRRLAERIGSIWQARTDRYSEERAAAAAGRERPEMSYLGG